MAKRTTRSTASRTPASTPESRANDIGGPATTTDNRKATDTAHETASQAQSATRNDSMASEPSEEEIRIRAYRRYLERGGQDGQHFEDWLEAERELKTR